ncbi:shikimate kinase [Microbacterium sp. NPDC091313]
MGAGKTSIGRRVAKQLGVRFVDTDAVVVRAHGPIPQIFADRGEEAFRALEHDAVAEALTGGGVISLGGGAVLHPTTRELLRAHRVVLLTVSPEVVAGRIRGSRRPLLQEADPLARWREIYAARKPLYDEVADVEFDTSRGPLQAVVDAIARWTRPTGSSPE